ncbi:MAG: type VI secretion system Vgr family protein [Planctomycetota bacterium]|jgi:type VI secretion system secreted protein VgrG
MPYTQENRFISIDTPLGKDALLLAGFQGNESISQPFRFELKLLSENHNIVFEDVVGKNVTIEITLADGSQRCINGLISFFSQKRGHDESGSDLNLSYYTATMVPWLWLLTRTKNSRIFQNLSVPDIVEKIFTDKGFRDVKLQLHGNYTPREYCVQYRETDFNFVSRLMEDEGIFYFFEHEKGRHTLLMADPPEDHQPCPNQETAVYQTTTGGWFEDDVITGIEKQQKITASKYTQTDYNFKTPATDLKVEATSQQALGPTELEIYHYPGEYEKRAYGEDRTNLRMQEVEAGITTINGSSVCRAFTSGYRFDLKGHYREEISDKPFVLTTITHEATTEDSYIASGGQELDGDFSYNNHFTCIPHSVPFRPRRITRKPIMRGTQTAIVTGPSGEEIYPDEHGRVKVQFHWDREGQRDDKSSCWIRVSQAWAGGGWGAMQIPRIGQEVIVDFLDGKPDYPVIIGRVYHGTNKPPYDLPGDKTKSTIKSDSSKGGEGSNELRFEDKKGEEEVFLHGQKNWTIAIDNDKNQTVGNDETLSVANNRTKDVGTDQKETIGSNKTIGVGSNHDETIGANMTQSVGSNKSETISIAKALTIGAAYQVSVGAAMNETVGAAKMEEIGAIKSVNVGANSSENVAANKSVDAGGNISESAGKDASISSGKKMSLSAGDDFGIKGDKKGVIEIKDELGIKCGKAMITLKKNGDIIIKGVKINITNGKGDITIDGKNVLLNS